MHHIRNTLPDIKTRVSQQLQRFNAELASLGGPHGDQNAGNVVLSSITEFTSEFRTMIDGNTNDLAVNELSGGARISFVFHELYNNGVKSIDPFDQVKDGDIRTILYNSSVSFQFYPLIILFWHYFLGFYTLPIRWNNGVWGYREATDQEVRRAQLEVLPACIRRVDSHPWSAPG